MIIELNKLNKEQQKKMREMFSGRTATSLHVDESISKVTVEFGNSVHFIMFGPRGRVVYHENRSK